MAATGHEPLLEVAGDVGLVEDDDRGDAARPGDGEVALEAAQVEVAVEAGDQERDVDVGRDDLLVGEVAGGPPAGVGGAAHEGRPAREDRGDHGGVVGAGPGVGRLERDPVPDGREVGRGERVEAEPPGHDGGPVTGDVAADDRGLLVHGDDPGGTPASGRERLEGLVPPGIPAEARRSGREGHGSADSLQLAGALGVALGPAERPQPERDEHDPTDEQRPHVVEQLGRPACRRSARRGRRRGRRSPATGATAPASTRAGPRPSSTRR